MFLRSRRERHLHPQGYQSQIPLRGADQHLHHPDTYGRYRSQSVLAEEDAPEEGAEVANSTVGEESDEYEAESEYDTTESEAEDDLEGDSNEEDDLMVFI